MAKEKKAYVDQEKKDLTFYYEIIGIISILIPTIALARLGVVGFYLMLTFRIFFGDWYFIFLIALLIYGLRSLIYHKPMNFKNMRAIGIIILMIAILILSHFPMHNYVKNYGTNYLGLTFELYLDYFKNYHEGMIVGGGVFGSIFFYLFYILFSSAGTVIITFILIFIGVAFTTRHTVKEFVGVFANFFISIFKKTGRVMKTLKYDIKRGEKLDLGRKHKKISLEKLAGFPQSEFSVVEEKHAEGVKRTIANVLNNMNIFYNDITFMISNHHTSYFIDTIAVFSLETFHLKLKRVLSDDFLIKQKRSKNSVVIEVNNIHPHIFDLKTHLQKDKTFITDLTIIYGIHSQNDFVFYQAFEINNIYLLGTKGAQNFIDSLSISILMKSGTVPFHVSFVDPEKLLHQWDGYGNYFNDPTILDEIKGELDRRLDLMHQHSINSIEEYNNSEHGKNPLSYEFVFISGLSHWLEISENKEKIMYLLQVGKQCGYIFIGWVNEDKEIPTVINSMFEDKLIFHSDFNVATKILGFHGTPQLDESSEAFYLHKEEVVRMSIIQTPNENVNLFHHKED